MLSLKGTTTEELLDLAYEEIFAVVSGGWMGIGRSHITTHTHANSLNECKSRCFDLYSERHAWMDIPQRDMETCKC